MHTIPFDLSVLTVCDHCDVLIVGGGTAGAIAGVSAARAGAHALIIEKRGALGGSETAALVTPVMHSGIPGDPQSSAIAEELRSRLQTMGGALPDAPDHPKGYFDTQAIGLALEDMVTESGCRLLYHTSCIGVVKDGDTITHAVMFNSEGISAISAKMFIDATADGALSVLSGAAYESGDATGRNQAVSLRFIMENVDIDRFAAFNASLGEEGIRGYPMLHAASVPGVPRWKLNPVFAKAHEDGLLTWQDIKYFQCFSLPGRPNTVCFNCPELGARVNVLEAAYLTDRQIEGKRAIRRLVRFLRERMPGFEQAALAEIASEIGIRESRRVVCEHMLCVHDLVGYTKFSDSIASSNYPVDIHDGADEKLQFADVPADGRYYTVPFRSLVVKDLSNLLVTGRCIGADFIAQSSARVQATCRSTGEAAGIGAALASEQGICARDIDGVRVRQIMSERGAQFK